MKRLLTILTSVMVLHSCSSSANAVQPTESFTAQTVVSGSLQTAPSKAVNTAVASKSNTAPVILNSMLKQQRTKQIRLSNRDKIIKAVSKVKKYAGKTWYAFGGATPRAWDCSGLVRWTYKQMGVDLYHSASVQMRSGKKVKTPKIGDLVAFSYGGRYAGHIGIYVGDGKFIHSPRPGVRTIIESVDRFAHNIGTRVVYTRILNTGDLTIKMPPKKRLASGLSIGRYPIA